MALSALSSGRCPCDGATLTDPLVFLAKTEQMVAGPEGCYWHTSANGGERMTASHQGGRSSKRSWRSPLGHGPAFLSMEANGG